MNIPKPDERVRIVNAPRGLCWVGRTGTVVDSWPSGLNGYDLAIRFDDDGRVGNVYASEVEVIEP